jgi:hypothetical protein
MVWPSINQGDVDDVGRCAPVLLDGQLHGGVAAIVEEALEPAELPLRVVADALRNLVVLALDDGPHGAPPGCGSIVPPGFGAGGCIRR